MTNQDPTRFDRIEATLATHNEILSQLAPLTAQMAQLLAQQTARGGSVKVAATSDKLNGIV
jgi:23S rRNA maturation-related 3'-5' exoribonuclease YhaM